ncbi:hypothetical protein LJC74_03985 [Eubacteriales bacterium OttesenSCG-928-A19]|nr:hypothetical protein [Eubacteriales bacterium OttesenSCG-928-A19]
MPKSRDKTRANKKKGQLLDKRNAYGSSDPTPYEADKKYNLDQRATRRN